MVEELEATVASPGTEDRRDLRIFPEVEQIFGPGGGVSGGIPRPEIEGATGTGCETEPGKLRQPGLHELLTYRARRGDNSHKRGGGQGWRLQHIVITGRFL
jgi:hypothetical protein